MKIVSIFLAAVALAVTAPARADMQLMSDDIAEGQPLGIDQVFDGFGCTGANVSPHLAWSGAPPETQSYIVTVYDPDAPTGSGWWHWTVFNIPATQTFLPRDAGNRAGGLPAGAVEGRTDYGATGFGGACPPEGDPPHRYVFTVFAMPIAELPLDGGASGALVGFFAQNQSLARATLTATYGR